MVRHILVAIIGFLAVSCYRSIDLTDVAADSDSESNGTDSQMPSASDSSQPADSDRMDSEGSDFESEFVQETDDPLPSCEPTVNPRVYWSVSVADLGFSRPGDGMPVSAGSYVYFRDGYGSAVFAVRAMDGVLQWFDAAFSRTGSNVHIAVGSKGDVYGTYLNPGYLTVAWDRFDGQAQRRYDTTTDGLRQNAPVFGPVDSMYLSDEKCVDREDPEDGEWLSGICFGQAGTKTPIFGSDGTAYVLGNRQLYAFRPEDWSEYWIHPDIGDMTVLSTDGLVFRRTGTTGTDISAVDATTGLTRWTHSRTVPISSLVDAAGDLLVATERDTVYALNSLDGTLLWSRYLVGTASTPVLAGGDAVFVYNGHVLYALHLESGQVLWTAGMDGDITGVVSGPDGVVYVTSKRGFLLAMDARSAEIRWLFDAGVPTYPPVITSGGTLLLSADGALFALSSNENAGGDEVECKPCALICDPLSKEIRQCLPDGSGSRFFASCEGREDCEKESCRL